MVMCVRHSKTIHNISLIQSLTIAHMLYMIWLKSIFILFSRLFNGLEQRLLHIVHFIISCNLWVRCTTLSLFSKRILDITSRLNCGWGLEPCLGSCTASSRALLCPCEHFFPFRHLIYGLQIRRVTSPYLICFIRKLIWYSTWSGVDVRKALAHPITSDELRYSMLHHRTVIVIRPRSSAELHCQAQVQGVPRVCPPLSCIKCRSKIAAVD